MAAETPAIGGGLLDWLTTTDHKQIGLLYIVTAFIFFLLAGLMAIAMRTELAQPGLQVLSEQSYADLFTMHGTLMLLAFATPTVTAFGNYLIPLQVGAPDMAYPRLNAMSYWIFLFAGLILMASFLTVGGPANGGWTFY
ncbi:MAG: cbb3-type cytochrome c oxidase subunit I, partial [Candidatus Limnocylindrales bacterium]